MVPPNHPILIGVSIIFTIHFVGENPVFLETPMLQNEVICSQNAEWFAVSKSTQQFQV